TAAVQPYLVVLDSFSLQEGDPEYESKIEKVDEKKLDNEKAFVDLVWLAFLSKLTVFGSLLVESAELPAGNFEATVLSGKPCIT
ncbi:hypothetical protein PJP10_32255, partial [Mycobacterium kansasii]